jgi:hypothetical protein
MGYGKSHCKNRRGWAIFRQDGILDVGRRYAPYTLPPQPTSLVGRASEQETARQQLLLDGVRLLTLWGPAGVGKTRLALAVATELLDAFPRRYGSSISRR